MLTLIAESKTMHAPEVDVATSDVTHADRLLPAGEKVAEEAMSRILGMSVEEVAAAVKVSQGMASRILKMAYDFPMKSTGTEAIRAFTGVVFKALDYDSLGCDAKRYVADNVRIISSLYGWLRPLDYVKPYRMEFSTVLAPGSKSWSQFWRKDVTINLVKTIKEREEHDIIDLMPGDAAKCVDRKLVKNFARIWKVDFKQMTDGGGYKTPHSGRLKELRGELLREMAERGITTVDMLKDLTTDNLLPLGTPDYPDHITFLTY